MQVHKQLIYDYSEGYVIDAETGEVVDRIFDYSPPRTSSLESEMNHNYRKIKHTPGKKLKKLITAYRKLVVYEEQGYIIDYEKLSSSKMIKTLKHEKSAKAELFFKENGLLDKLTRTIEELDKRGVTSGMTIRGRLVLAYILYKLARGETPEYGELRKIVSESTIRRIRKRLKKFLNTTVSGNAKTVNR